MNHNVEPNDEVKRYFASLPVNVQETIKQTGMSFFTVDELRACADTLTGTFL